MSAVRGYGVLGWNLGGDWSLDFQDQPFVLCSKEIKGLTKTADTVGKFIGYIPLIGSIYAAVMLSKRKVLTENLNASTRNGLYLRWGVTLCSAGAVFFLFDLLATIFRKIGEALSSCGCLKAKNRSFSL